MNELRLLKIFLYICWHIIFSVYLMKYSYFFFSLMLIGCLSSPKQQEESSQIASDIVVEAKEQRYFSKNVENEILLRKAMVDALQKIADSFHGEALDTLEYILPDAATKGKTFLKGRNLYGSTKEKEIHLAKLPKEYQTVIGLDYFLNYIIVTND